MAAPDASGASASPRYRLPAGLAEFPLFEALVGRRSRRFAEGMTIPDGPLAYASAKPPRPLTDVERAVLVFAAAGITGWNLGMPHTASGDPEAGSNYPVRLVGRTAPSAAAIGSSEVLVADDSGTYITATRNADAETIERIASMRRLDDLVEAADGMLVKLGDARLELPAAPPFMAAHNRWVALQPGTTLLVPVTDMTEEFINFVGMFSGEGVLLWDMAADAPLGRPDALLRQGRLADQARMPFQALEQLVFQMGSVDSSLMASNAQLALQAMGLGGWLFSGVDGPSLLGVHADAGAPGFGFRFEFRPEWGVPNPVGLDGAFETLAAPYAASPREAIERFIARKFGDGGAFADSDLGPYADNRGVKARIQRYDDDMAEYLVSVLEGLDERFGRYPGTIPTVLTSTYVQAQHVDADYYDRFHGERALLPTHRSHDADWHGA